MKKLLTIICILIVCNVGMAQQLINGSRAVPITNATSTGTTLNKLVKLTGTGTAVITSTSDVSGVIGVCAAGCGITATSAIASFGIQNCVFDGATTANDYVQISNSVAGDCHDTGSSLFPASGQVIGRVLSTNGSGGTYSIFLSGAEVPSSSADAPITANSILMNPTGSSGAAIPTVLPACATDGAHVQVYDTTAHTWSCVSITAGTMSSTGSPSSNQLAVFVNPTTVQSVAGLSLNGGTLAVPNGIAIPIPNASSTGTTLNKLTKLTGVGTAVILGTTDTTGAIGICSSGCGTTGSATISRFGMQSCVFDGATTANDYVQSSTTVAGDCHDVGGVYPISGQTIGRILSTNGSGGTYSVVMDISTDNTTVGFVNVKNYGALGDNTTDDSTAIQNAIDAACSASPIQGVMFPPGAYKIYKPLRQWCSNVIKGTGIQSTAINVLAAEVPAMFQAAQTGTGTGKYEAAAWGSDLFSGGASDKSFYSLGVDSGANWGCFNLNDGGGFRINALAAMTVEFRWKQDTLPSGNGRTMLVSAGGVDTTASAFLIAMDSNAKVHATLKTSNGTFTVVNDTLMVAGTTYDIAASYDGSNLRLFVNGTLTGGTATIAATGTVVQASYEDVNIGCGTSFPSFENGFVTYANKGWIDGIRLSNNARYTVNYSPTGIAPTLDGTSKLVLNFATNYDLFTGAQVAGTGATNWLVIHRPTGGAGTSNQLVGAALSDMSITGTVMANNGVGNTYSDLLITHSFKGLWLVNNNYLNTISNVHVTCASVSCQSSVIIGAASGLLQANSLKIDAGAIGLFADSGAGLFNNFWLQQVDNTLYGVAIIGDPNDVYSFQEGGISCETGTPAAVMKYSIYLAGIGQYSANNMTHESCYHGFFYGINGGVNYNFDQVNFVANGGGHPTSILKVVTNPTGYIKVGAYADISSVGTLIDDTTKLNLGVRSNQPCSAGQAQTGIDVNGLVTCASVVRPNASNTFSTGTQDFTNITLLKLRIAAGLTTASNGEIGFDTTNNNWRAYNGVDSIIPVVAVGTAVNAQCPVYVVVSGKVTFGAQTCLGANAYDTSTNQSIGAHFMSIVEAAVSNGSGTTTWNLGVDSTTHKLKCANSAGATCLPAGTSSGSSGNIQLSDGSGAFNALSTTVSGSDITFPGKVIGTPGAGAGAGWFGAEGTDPGDETSGVSGFFNASTGHCTKFHRNGGTASCGAIFSDKLSVFAATSSSELAGVLSDETGSGLAVFGTSPTITTPIFSGAITFPSNVRQTFVPGATNSGLNVGAVASDPSSLSNGDIWYNSTGTVLKARINGSTVSLGAGGGGSPGGSSGDVQINNGSGGFAAAAINDNGSRVAITEPFILGTTPDQTIAHSDTNTLALVDTDSSGNFTSVFRPISRMQCISVSPVTVNANTTSDQTLMSCALEAGLLNLLGRTMRVSAKGVYTTAASSTAQLTLKIKLCTVSGCGSGTVITPISIQTAALSSVTASNEPWSLNSDLITQTAGASSAYEASGRAIVNMSTALTTANVLLLDGNTSTTGTIDSTGIIYLQVTGAFSAGSGTNQFVNRVLMVEILN